MSRAFARFYLRLFGWRVEAPPEIPKRCVVIAAPHTSSWDFGFALAACYVCGLNVYWMGKNALFPRPLAPLVRWLGGVAVDRSHGQGAASRVMRAFRHYDEFIVVIPPEGTRAPVKQWKRGFYTIARDNGVPIVCGFLDYGRKVAGFGHVFMPTGDYEADMVAVYAFYSKMTPRHPQLFVDLSTSPTQQRKSSTH